MRITIADIEVLKAKLAALPPAPRVPTQTTTKMGAVAAIAPELLALREKGWGLEALAAFLTQTGLEITPGTLKNYLQRAGAIRSTRRRRKGRANVSLPPRTESTTSLVERVPATPRVFPSEARPVAEETERQWGTFVVRPDSDEL